MNPKKKIVKSPNQKKKHDKHRPRTSKIQPRESDHKSLDKTQSSFVQDPDYSRVEREEFKKQGSTRVLTLSPSSLKSETFDLQQFEGLPDQEPSVAHGIENSIPPQIDLEFVNEKFQPPPITSTMNLSPRPSHGILKKRYNHQNQYDYHHHHYHHQQQNIYSSTPSIFPENGYLSHAPFNYPPVEEDNLRVVNYQPQVPSSTHVSPSKSLRVEQSLSPPLKLTMEGNGLKSGNSDVGINENYFPAYSQKNSIQHPNHLLYNARYRNLTDVNHMTISQNNQRVYRRSNNKIQHGDMMLHHISGANSKMLERYNDENRQDFEEEEEEEEEYEDRDNNSRGNKRNRGNNSQKRSQSSELFVNLTFQEICESIFLGNAPLIRDFLSCKQDDWKWWPFHIIECFFRSISAISLTSNIFCGIILYVTMILVNPLPTVLGTIAIFSGIFTSLCLQIPLESIRTGGWTFNSFLLGIVIGELSLAIDWMERWDVFVVAAAAGSIVIFVCGGVNSTFENRLRLPMLNFPFNLVALLYIKSGIALLYHSSSMDDSISSTSNVFQGINGVDLKEGSNETGTVNTMLNGENNYSNIPLTPILDATMNKDTNGLSKTTIDWIRVIEGIILTPSHFYGTKTILSSSIVYLNYLIFSRLFFCQAVLGAVIGSSIGLALDDSTEKYSLVYNGGFAYNSLLTSITIGGLFFVFNLKSWILSIISSILAALLYATMSKTNVTLGIPFMIISWIFLSASYSRNDLNENIKSHSDPTRTPVHSSSTSIWKRWMTLYRVSNISTPENHLKEYLKLVSRDKHTTKKEEHKRSSNKAPLQLQL